MTTPYCALVCPSILWMPYCMDQ